MRNTRFHGMVFMFLLTISLISNACFGQSGYWPYYDKFFYSLSDHPGGPTSATLPFICNRSVTVIMDGYCAGEPGSCSVTAGCNDGSPDTTVQNTLGSSSMDIFKTCAPGSQPFCRSSGTFKYFGSQTGWCTCTHCWISATPSCVTIPKPETLNAAIDQCNNDHDHPPSYYTPPPYYAISVPINEPVPLTCNSASPTAVESINSVPAGSRRAAVSEYGYKFNVLNVTGTWDPNDAMVVCDDVIMGNGTNIMFPGNEIVCPVGANFKFIVMPEAHSDMLDLVTESSSLSSSRRSSSSSTGLTSSSGSSGSAVVPNATITITKFSSSGNSSSSINAPNSHSSSAGHHDTTTSSSHYASGSSHGAGGNAGVTDIKSSNQWWPWVTGTAVGVAGAVATTAVLVYKCRHRHNAATEEVDIQLQ